MFWLFDWLLRCCLLGAGVGLFLQSFLDGSGFGAYLLVVFGVFGVCMIVFDVVWITGTVCV